LLTPHTHMSWYLLRGQFLSIPISTCMLTQRHRPEGIGEGNHHLYVSDEFNNVDPSLLARIDKVTRELNDIALDLAHRAGLEVRSRKKRRPDGASPSLSTSPASASCSTSRNSVTQNQASTQMPNHIATPNINPPGSSTSVLTQEPAPVATPPTSKPFGMEKKKVASIVRALMYVVPFRLLSSVD
jgi:hypothetical protein